MNGSAPIRGLAVMVWLVKVGCVPLRHFIMRHIMAVVVSYVRFRPGYVGWVEFYCGCRGEVRSGEV